MKGAAWVYVVALRRRSIGLSGSGRQREDPRILDLPAAAPESQRVKHLPHVTWDGGTANRRLAGWEGSYPQSLYCQHSLQCNLVRRYSSTCESTRGVRLPIRVT